MVRTDWWARTRVACAEVAVVLAASVAYSAMRVLVEGGETRAVEHAFDLAAIERGLGIFHEQSIHEAVQSRPWLASLMNVFYVQAYFPMLVGAAAFMYVRDRPLYRAYRNTFFASAIIGLFFFALVPVAPPRMLPELGFLDPMHATMATSAVKNEFAAMPSFHFGFTLLAAIGVAHVLRWRLWVSAALALVPAVMLVTIVSTANHFFLDAAIGGLVVLAMRSVFVGSDSGGISRAREGGWISA